MRALFSGLGVKIAGFFAVIAGFFAVIAGFFMVKSKLQAHKIENLEEENASHEKLNAIEKSVKQAEIKAEVKEDEAIKDFDDSDWRNNI